MSAEDYVSAADREKRLASLADEIEDKLKTHLPRTRNLELVVIKCHLLLEFMLNQFIELMAPTEYDVDSLRFSFPQKLGLVHMLGFPCSTNFLPSADLLNSIRNSVAHTFSVDREKVDQLIRINCEDPNDAKGLSDAQRASALRRITYFMCAMMHGVITGMHEGLWTDDEKGEQHPERGRA